jgi:hypothetical protein
VSQFGFVRGWCVLRNERKYDWKRVPGWTIRHTRKVTPITTAATARAGPINVLVRYADGRLGICHLGRSMGHFGLASTAPS